MQRLAFRYKNINLLMKILFHPTGMNSLWQLNVFDQLSSCGSCIEVILIEPPHFQFASYGPVKHYLNLKEALVPTAVLLDTLLDICILFSIDKIQYKIKITAKPVERTTHNQLTFTTSVLKLIVTRLD